MVAMADILKICFSKMLKIHFKDRGHGSHLGFPIETIFAVFKQDRQHRGVDQK